MVATLLDMSVSTLEQHKDNEFNILSKEEIHETEFGTKITYGPKETPRKLLIRLSEEFLKPTYGPTYFGRLAAREVGRSSNSLIIFTDCGFTTECNTLIGQYGRANTLLCRLHRDGCNFENDSRSYLPDIAGANYDIQNNGSIAVGTALVARRIRDTFGIALNKEIEI